MLTRLCEDGGERSKTCFCQLMPHAAIFRLFTPAGYKASASTKAHSNWIRLRWKTVSVSYVIELEQLSRKFDWLLSWWMAKSSRSSEYLVEAIGNSFMRAYIDTIENRSEMVCVVSRTDGGDTKKCRKHTFARTATTSPGKVTAESVSGE